MDLTNAQRVAQMIEERERAERTLAEYRRLRHLMFVAPTQAEQQAAMEALRALSNTVREV